MLLQYYVVRVLCCCVIMLLQYYVVRVLHYCNITTELIYTYADYQYITVFIKQRIQLYYNNLHTNI